jgi:hypothetical protein
LHYFPVLGHQSVLIQGCDPFVAEALECFFELTTAPHPSATGQRVRHPSLSLTSRKFSIWAKLRKHLDPPLTEAIHRFRGPWDSRLLIDFKPSTAGRIPPAFCIDWAAWEKAKLYGLPVALVVPFHHDSASTPQLPLSTTDQAVKTMCAWCENLREAIGSVPRVHESPEATKAAAQFCSTLGTIRNLLKLLQNFRALRGADPLGTHRGASPPQLPDSKTRSQGPSYCELCWRLSMRSTAMGMRPKVPGTRTRQLSNRFCAEHNPSDPTSRYRIDYRYKNVFLRETLFGKRTDFLVNLSLPTPATAEEARKTAYDRAHARIRPLSNPDKPSFRESVWNLHLKGKPQADIARQLGTSRQSVFRTLKKTKELIARFEQSRLPDSRRKDYGPFENKSLLVDAVEMHSGDGLTPTEIQRWVNEPLDLIEEVLQWLRDHPRSSQG